MPNNDRWESIGVEYMPDYVRTPSLYLPMGKWAHEMTYNELLRGLCHRAQGGKGVDECYTCAAPCTIGKMLLKRKEEQK